MGFGGRWKVVVLGLGALLVTGAARATEGGPLLVFDVSAEALPQAEIRASIERELGRPLATTKEGASGELTILVDAEHRLVVRYQTPHGSIDRYLPMPNEPGDVSLIIALAAGNLARDPTAGVEPSRAEAASPPPMPAPPVDPMPTAPAIPEQQFQRHFVGVHVAQDIAIVGGSNVCDANLGQKADNYACFYEGSSDEPFWHTPYPYQDSVDTGPVLATTRLLVSYDFAIFPALSVGARFGYAFRGGPPAGQVPRDGAPANLNQLPAHAKGVTGSPFLPAHVELRATAWIVPLTKRTVSAYVGAGFGVAQVDAKTTVEERDCAATLDESWDAANGTFAECRRGDSSFDWKAVPVTKIDAWKKLGQGFAAVSLGGMFRLVGEARLVANLNAMYMFPSLGIVLEPSLGVMTALPNP